MPPLASSHGPTDKLAMPGEKRREEETDTGDGCWASPGVRRTPKTAGRTRPRTSRGPCGLGLHPRHVLWPGGDTAPHDLHFHSRD